MKKFRNVLAVILVGGLFTLTACNKDPKEQVLEEAKIKNVISVGEQKLDDGRTLVTIFSYKLRSIYVDIYVVDNGKTEHICESMISADYQYARSSEYQQIMWDLLSEEEEEQEDEENSAD